MISLQDIHKYFADSFTDPKSMGIEEINAKTELSMKWLFQNYEDMDEAAKSHVDKISEGIYRIARENIDKMQESPTKRKLHRTHLAGQGKHIRAEQVFRQLEEKPTDINEIVESSEALLLQITQNILDMLLDISERIKSNEKDIIILSLLYACVDEIHASLHLARHHFYVQSNSHLRTVHESLDKISLFSKFPEMIEIWKGNNYDDKNKYLTPSAIRKKLEKCKYDKLYGFLSELGTHATYRTFQARTTFKVSENERKSIHIFVSGTPYVHLQLWNYLCCSLIANLTLCKVAEFGEAYLNEEEALQLLDSSYKDSVQFFKDKIIPWASDLNLDTEEIGELFKEINPLEL